MQHTWAILVPLQALSTTVGGIVGTEKLGEVGDTPTISDSSAERDKQEVCALRMRRFGKALRKTDVR
jgi:hypothetical protein